MSPWFDTDCGRQKLLVRRLERRWRAERTAETKSDYRHAKRAYQKLCQDKLNSFWKNKLVNTGTNNKWPVLQRLLFRTHPEFNHNHSAEDFSRFFETKIDNIRHSMIPLPPAATNAAPRNHLVSLDEFSLVTSDEIKERIASCPNKQCALDAIPMSVMKYCADMLTPFLASLTNACLQHGIMPSREKTSYITPLLKKPTLDHNDLTNYRPISNVSILSKLIERCVTQRLFRHFERVPLPDNQSAYRSNHSTETATYYSHQTPRSNRRQTSNFQAPSIATLSYLQVPTERN